MEDQLTSDEIISVIQGIPTDRPREEIIRDIRARHAPKTNSEWFLPYGRKIYAGAMIEVRKHREKILSAKFHFGQGSEEFNLLIQVKIVFSPALIFTRNREYSLEILAALADMDQEDTPKSLEDLGAELIKSIIFQRDQHLKKI